MPDEEVLRTSHPYINQLIPVRASGRPVRRRARRVAPGRPSREPTDGDPPAVHRRVAQGRATGAPPTASATVEAGGHQRARLDPANGADDGTGHVSEAVDRPAIPMATPNRCRHEPAAGTAPVSPTGRPGQAGRRRAGICRAAPRPPRRRGRATTWSVSTSTSTRSSVWRPGSSYVEDISDDRLERGPGLGRYEPTDDPDAHGRLRRRRHRRAHPAGGRASPTSPCRGRGRHPWPATCRPGRRWSWSPPPTRAPPRSWWLPSSKRGRA